MEDILKIIETVCKEFKENIDMYDNCIEGVFDHFHIYDDDYLEI